MDLACDIDEAATLHPTTSHETAVAIAAITGKPLLIPHSGLGGANGDDTAMARIGAGSTERRPSVEAGPTATPKGGGLMEPSGMSSLVKGGGGASSGPGSLGDGMISPKGGKGKDGAAGAGPGGKAADGKDGKGAGRWLSFSRLTACFDFRADRKAEAANADIAQRIDDAFLQVPENSSGGADAKHIAALLSAITGGREIPKADLEVVVKLIDSERNGSISKAEFASGLVVLKQDPTLSRLLGPELSRLLDYRASSQEGSTTLPQNASAFAIHPKAPWLLGFKKLVLFIGVFYLFEVPVRITFRVAHRLGPWYLFFDHLQDMVLLADMLIMFCTAYVNKKSVLTYDMRRIRKHYLSTTFPLDVVASFPLDLVVMMTTTRKSTGYVDYSLMGWLRVLKLLRLYRVWQSFKEQSSDLKAGTYTRPLFRST